MAHLILIDFATEGGPCPPYGLLPPSSGHATVAGHDIGTRPAAVRRIIGYVPQALSADGELTGYENLLIGLDHRFGQHPPLHRYQPWQAGFPVDGYGRNPSSALWTVKY